MYGLDDVLERLLAQIIDVEGNLAASVIEDRLRYADAARLRQSLQPRRNVHPVAIEVAPLDYHIAKVDPDAEFYSFLRSHIGIACAHALLDLDRATYRIHDTWKLNEDAITHRFHDATAVLLVLRVDQFSAILLEAGKRAGLIRTHQPAITGDIGGEYSGEFALDRIGSHLGLPPAGYPLRITAGSEMISHQPTFGL